MIAYGVYLSVWFTSFSMIISRSVQVALFHSFYGWIIFHCVCVYTMYIYIYMYVHVYIYHVFFIHSSVDGPLGCFQVLAIVNSASVPLFSLSLCPLPELLLPQPQVYAQSARPLHSPSFHVLPESPPLLSFGLGIQRESFFMVIPTQRMTGLCWGFGMAGLKSSFIITGLSLQWVLDPGWTMGGGTR